MWNKMFKKLKKNKKVPPYAKKSGKGWFLKNHIFEKKDNKKIRMISKPLSDF